VPALFVRWQHMEIDSIRPSARDFRKKERRQPDISPLFLHRQYDLSE
jgi:hypothetical protein